MHWTYRPGEIKDIATCYRLLPDAFVCDVALRETLPEIWRQWLLSDLIHLTVIEDSEYLSRARPIAFGCSTFVTDQFASEVENARVPYVSADVARRWSDGHSPILTPKAIRQANSNGGLNLLILHLGWDEEIQDEDLRLIKSKLLEAFFYTHAGYNLKSILQEVYSTGEMVRGGAFGAPLKNDYASYFETYTEEFPPMHLRPYLIGVRRDEVQEGTGLSSLFNYTRPRFLFKPGEQKMLSLALIDHADADLALALNLSLSAVHKKWRAIYTRVTDVMPEFFGEDGDVAQDRRRGLEKRRLILGYLRHHPEELRPILAAK